MAIKDKDGNVYKLRGPNPLLKEQADWDSSNVKLINCRWKSEVIEDQRNPIEEAKAKVIDIGEELQLEENPKAKVISAKNFIDEIREQPKLKKVTPQSPKPVEKPKEEPPQETVKEKDQVVLNVSPKLARILKERGVEYHCAPVVGSKSYTDELYGNSYELPQYGEQFVFDAVVIDQSDLQLQFWCVSPINKNSVVYRKMKEGGERWWRVAQVEPKTGGFLVIANISDSNPDFS